MADIRIIINAANKASADLQKVKQDVKGVGDAGTQAKSGVDGFANGIGAVMGKAVAVAGTLVAVSAALKQVYDSMKEGAELEYAAGRFDRLAEAAGTTADVLLGDLKEATNGMLSDAELMSSAGDLMALGLATTREEVIRLTTVAGALGMNMNQLVLTLTNQTTMRFDALGVSVAGFDEKVKALEESGMSAQEAFSEAFLQQAEEQIKKVGSASDYAIGDIMRFEAAIKNLGDTGKQSLLPLADTVIPALTAGFDNLNRTQKFNQLRSDVERFGLSIDGLTAPYEVFYGQFIKTDETLVNQMKLMDDWATTTYDGFVKSGMGSEEAKKKVIDLFNAFGTGVFATQDWADANYDGADAVTRIQIAMELLNDEIEKNDFSTEKFIETATGWGTQLTFMTGQSDTYAGLLAEIAEKQEELSNMTPWKRSTESGKELEGEIDALIAKLDNLSTKMKMEALQTAIEANGEVTEKEYGMMLDYMEQAGVINEQTKIEMMKDWKETNDFQQGLRWDAEGNVTIYTDDALKTIEELKEEMRSIERNIGITVSVSQMGELPKVINPYLEAVGGAVTSGTPYTWQEYGYRGEVFVPSADGFVLSRADAERALARALYGGESAADPEAIGKAVARALSGITGNKQGGGNVYNLTMPTSSNPADVRTAFELMEAWA